MEGAQWHVTRVDKNNTWEDKNVTRVQQSNKVAQGNITRVDTNFHKERHKIAQWYSRVAEELNGTEGHDGLSQGLAEIVTRLAKISQGYSRGSRVTAWYQPPP